MDIAFWNDFFSQLNSKQHFQKQSASAMNAYLPVLLMDLLFISALKRVFLYEIHVSCLFCYLSSHCKSDQLLKKGNIGQWQKINKSRSPSCPALDGISGVNSDSIHVRWWSGEGWGGRGVVSGCPPQHQPSSFFLLISSLLPRSSLLLPPWAPFIPPSW